MKDWKTWLAVAAVVICGVAILVLVINHFRQKRAAKPKGRIGFAQAEPEPIV